MAYLAPYFRIFGASLIAIVFIGGAYALAKGGIASPKAEASTETALLQTIAAKDSDHDGLPDWEEALYGTDPHVQDTRKFGMTDEEAVMKGLIVPKAVSDVSPASATAKSDINYDSYGLTAPTEGSFTDTFAKQFFALYLSKKQENQGAELSSSDLEAVEKQVMDLLGNSVAPAPDFKSVNDFTIAGSGSGALKTFAENVEAVFRHNASTATMSEIDYLTRAVENDDASALSALASLAKADRDSAFGIAALPVPRELASADVKLVNALMRISQIVNDFSRVSDDPLVAMLALQQYGAATRALGQAFADIAGVYSAQKVVLPAGAPGSAFLGVATAVSSL